MRIASAQSYYNIFQENICVQTPDISINNYCDFILNTYSRPYLSDCSNIQVKPLKNNNFQVLINEQIGQLSVRSRVWGRKNIVEYKIDELPKVLSYFAIQHALRKETSSYKFHSCGVCKNGSGILIIGSSGSGKSTFTLELVANHRWKFLSDDCGMVSNNLEIQPINRAISHDDEIVNLDRAWNTLRIGNEYHTLVPNQSVGSNVKLVLLVFIAYSSNCGTELRKIRKTDGLLRLYGSQKPHSNELSSIEEIATIIKKVDTVELKHSDVKHASVLLNEWINTGRYE